jgi:membrane protease YdiL (CAAX protease family)
MNEIEQTQVRRQVVVGGTSGQCNYCGARLDPFFYFCMQCATPYKQVETIVGRVRPITMGDEERVKTMVPQVWTLFGTYGAVIIGAALVALGISGATGKGPETFLITGSLAITITTAIFASIYWRSLAVQLKTFGFNHWAAWAGLGILIPLLGLNLGYHAILRSMMDAPDSMTEIIQALGLPGTILLICVFPAVMEEIAFRGLLQHWLSTAVKPYKAMMMAAALFAALHFSPLSFPILFLVGLLLGWMKQQTKSLYPSMLAHFLHNLTIILISYYA